MSLNIQKATDPVSVDTINLLIYGQPGIGKTSLAFTATDPLLLDFDQGAYRSGFRRDAVPVTSWDDVESMTADDLEPYRTIVVDTAGRCLDMLAADLIAQNPKLAKRSGALTLQGYGDLKAAFAGWAKKLQMMGKDLVVVAHDKEDKKGDDLIVRPDVQGGSYAELFKLADGVGYMHSVGKKAMLDFSPTDEWVGKNPAGFDSIKIPNFAQDSECLAGIIQRVKDTLGNLSDESAAIAAAVKDFAKSIAGAENADDMNVILEAINTQDKTVMAQAKQIMNKRVKALDLTYDKKAGEFKDADKRDAA